MSEARILPALPPGALRSGFEAAARTHEQARATIGNDAPTGAVRQIAGPHNGSPVQAAIASAAERTSIDFSFLLAQAEVESAMNPHARARTSSATGLYQFIDSTWLHTLKRHGERFGLGGIADEISVTGSGSAWVADPDRRAAILALRKDPEIASLMAAGLAEDNRAHLMPILGRQPDHAELYLAHFLGAGGAGRFLAEMQHNPSQSAAALFSRPAAANRGIFYTGEGSPRSLAQVMDLIGSKMERGLDRASAGQAVQFARADYGAGTYLGAEYAAADLGASIRRAPYLSADQSVFGPGYPPPVTLGSQPYIAPAATFGGAGGAATRAPMSQVLGATFGADGNSAPVQVRRAYDRLKALGL